MRLMPELPADKRFDEALAWSREILETQQLQVTPVSGDASFRRYFRIHQEGRDSLILMDAPPDKEDSRPFLDVANRLSEAGLRAPAIYHFDLALGFGILEDFGDELYKSVIDKDSANTVFPELLQLLAQMAGEVSPDGLPPYDAAFLQQELDLFTDWYLVEHRKRPLNHAERETWASLCKMLIDSAQKQPQGFVHRDFHSCNLLFNEGQPPGIIDFQDAMHGPVSYDFISLAWDRYIHWSRAQIEEWMEEMRGLMDLGIERERWIRYCDLMGLQRNLKIVGIFARLHYRDNKAGYLDMIPMFYTYLLDVLPRYPEFSDFHTLLKDPSCAP